MEFDSSTQYRKAWHYLSHRGRVVIADGSVTLFNHAGRPIESSPVASFSVPKQGWNLGNNTYVVFGNGAKYTLSLRSTGADAVVEAYGPIATTVVGDARQVFLNALAAARSASAAPPPPPPPTP